MHHAPAVTLPVVRSHGALRLSLLAWLAGWGTLALWWVTAEPSPGRLAVLSALQLGAGVLAWRGWRAAPRGRLLWDGSLWHWEAATDEPAAGQPRPLHAPAVVLDFQSLILVRTARRDGATGAPVPQAFWLERSAAGGAGGDETWQSLRRAVYSRAATPGPTSQREGAADLP